MTPDLQADRELAQTVACNEPRPHGCGAAIGEPCRNLGTGEPLLNLPAHDARMRAAGIRHAPLDIRLITNPYERTPRS